MTDTPPAEVEIDPPLVRRLLEAQHPDLAGLPITPLASGWDNVMFRLGDDLNVRLPRRIQSAFLILSEQRWLPDLAPRLPLPIPAPVRVGVSSDAYAWPWSVTPWLEGGPCDQGEPDAGQGEVLGAFLAALHAAPVPDDAPANPYRGGPLADRAPFVAERLARVRAATDLVTPAIDRLWDEALAAPIDAEPTWLHGDLHARNILTREGRFCAVIDWGDITRGDPATDLAAVWMLLPDRQDRAACLQRYGPISEATLARARGWAISMGAMLCDIGLGDDPRMGVMGARTLARLIDGP